jgi:hypothetical protein
MPLGVPNREPSRFRQTLMFQNEILRPILRPVAQDADPSFYRETGQKNQDRDTERASERQSRQGRQNHISGNPPPELFVAWTHPSQDTARPNGSLTSSGVPAEFPCRNENRRYNCPEGRVTRLSGARCLFLAPHPKKGAAR